MRIAIDLLTYLLYKYIEVKFSSLSLHKGLAMPIRTYLDPAAPNADFRISKQWIDDRTYATMVEKSVICCADAIITLRGDIGAVYLAQRCVYPMKGFWCLGGRVFFNDPTDEHTIARAVEKETGVQFERDRFRYLCVNDYVWACTAQGEFPGRNRASLYQLDVYRDELDQMSAGLSSTEYDTRFGLQRFDMQRMQEEAVHPAMLHALSMIIG